MKILIVPDSFKGSLSSNEVCNALKTAIESCFKNYSVKTIPFSDGGEGFCECYNEIANGEKVILYTLGTFLEPQKSFYIKNNDTAVIESACASGLKDKKDILNSSTFGTGQIIKHAIENGCKTIVLGLGGTGTNDGGIGALNALGIDFYDKSKMLLKPVSKNLNKIAFISTKNMNENIRKIKFIYATDVTNEFYGKNGAAYIFARQKGADESQVSELDKGLKNLSDLLKKQFGADIQNTKGAGAAGGLCGGLYAMFSGEIKSGFDFLNECSQLEKEIEKADIVITGEGKTDKQTLMGKLPFKIYELCKKHKTKCFVISGMIEDVNFADKMISLTNNNISTEYAINHAKELLKTNAIKLLQ